MTLASSRLIKRIIHASILRMMIWTSLGMMIIRNLGLPIWRHDLMSNCYVKLWLRGEQRPRYPWRLAVSSFMVPITLMKKCLNPLPPMLTLQRDYCGTIDQSVASIEWGCTTNTGCDNTVEQSVSLFIALSSFYYEWLRVAVQEIGILILHWYILQ